MGTVQCIKIPGGDMKRTITAALAALALASLTGCATAKSEAAVAAPAASPEPVASPADALKTAIQGYTGAFLEGDVAGTLVYLHKDCASDEDRGSAALAVASAHNMAKGATMTIDSVQVDGMRGRVGDWHLSSGAPDALRRALKASAAEQAESMPWRLVDGEWSFRSTTCAGGAS